MTTADTATQQTQTVKLRFVPINVGSALSSMMAPEIEHKIMHKLQIVPAEGRSQLHRWLEVMAAENGVDLKTMQEHIRAIQDPCRGSHDPLLAGFIFAIA